ncbi:MAG: J domain-containing protein [Pseudomonadota bacterium]
MPKIHLKPQSPEFVDQGPSAEAKQCDMPGCCLAGVHRAPKDRSLNEYYYFCADHIVEYNKAWDYFDGMSAAEIEDHIIRSATWDRPTRKFSDHSTEELYRKAQSTYNFTEDEPKQQSRYYSESERSTPEFEALALMGLEPPIDLDGIKKRYKELAKKYHPDLNRNDPKAEELLKSINMAYTILKLAYEKFDHLQPETV